MQDREKAFSLAKEISEDKTLEILNLQKKDLQSDTASIIFEAVIPHPSITHVDLSCNRIAGKAVMGLVELLKSNTKIISLDIGFNCFTPADIKIICDAVRVNRTLRRLVFNNNQFDDTCAQSLQMMLEKNNRLEHLELQYTKLTDGILNALSLGLARNTNLRHLDLHGNLLSNTAASGLALALKENKTLSEIIVGGENLWVLDHRVTSSALQYFVEALPHNVTLRSFHIADASLCLSAQFQSIQKGMERNNNNYACVLGILVKARIDAHENETSLRWLPKELLAKILRYIYPKITVNGLEKLGKLLLFKPSTTSSSLNQAAACGTEKIQFAKL